MTRRWLLLGPLCLMLGNHRLRRRPPGEPGGTWYCTRCGDDDWDWS